MESCNKNENCNCPNVQCPHYGNCKDCINAHLEGGTPVYCMAKLCNNKDN
ncbi:hypothetical protein [Methanococcus voltae]|uniref:Uncharacterized protein n=2 Tax=Methanococcus voltae TaxID=2188 RepID=A0A8J7USK5_METVO|nr:hypothetical protein [Methanococcus voltae]MBP2172843.1 hypothetical protein [Methanococcus voltae]MBP2201747.1 hypothetical protein [Methanococcus voltae]MCS3922535.1 hypothetical protein [Methanococcus voltae PS]